MGPIRTQAIPSGRVPLGLLDDLGVVASDALTVNRTDAGHVDFVGELRAGLRAADAALFVVSAVGGMMSG